MAKSTEDDHARSQLSRQLQARLTTIQYSNPNSALNLFQAFDLTGFSYKGQITSGYGERGTKMSLDILWDFGDLILPGLVSAELAAGVSGQKTRYTLILVARQPREVYMESRHGNAGWQTVHPLCLAMLSGYAAEMKAHAGVSASIGYTTGVDELGLEFTTDDAEEKGLKASTEATADLSGRILRLRDTQPRFYPPSAWDDSLAVDFVASMDVLTRHQIKNLIKAWLEAQASPADWDRIRAFLEEQTKDHKEALEKRKEDAETWVKEDLTDLNSLEAKWKSLGITVETPVFFLRALRAIKVPKTADLLKGLVDLEKALPAQEQEPGLSKERKAELKRIRFQIKRYREQLETLQSAKVASKVDGKQKKGQSAARTHLTLPTNLSHLCYLNLFAVDGGGSAEAAGKANFKLTNPVSKSHEVSGSVDLKASVAGRARMISFRLQTLASGSRPLVVTQDTVLSYREVDALARANASLDLNLPKGYTTEEDSQREGEKEKAFVYRTMTYQSAIVYWIYPAQTTQARIAVRPAVGSGISFGMGIQVTRLLQAAKLAGFLANPAAQKALEEDEDQADALAAHAKLIARIATQLHVPAERVEAFLAACGIGYDDPDEYPAEVVLLEAGFAFTTAAGDKGARPLTVEAIMNKDGYRLPDMLTAPAVKTLVQQLKSDPAAQDGLTLNTMRLRYRLGDSKNRNETIFKLGFSFVVGFAFDVERIKTSGHEGIIDLYTWFADDELNAKPLLGQEVAVPPVAMLHQ